MCRCASSDDMNIDAESIEVGNNSVAPLKLVSLREFLKVFALVCQMKLKRRGLE